MNSCFLNEGGFGDCAENYKHFKGLYKLNTCNRDTEIHMNNLKLIKKTSSVKSQILAENQLILLRSNKDSFYSDITVGLSICSKHRYTQGCGWKPKDKCCDVSWDHESRQKKFDNRVDFDIALTLIRFSPFYFNNFSIK